MESTSRWVKSGAVLLVLAAVVLRVYLYAVGSANAPVTSDEALTVLQAVDIRHGDFPLLMAGQPYMFPVEAYWMAPLEPLLPRTAFGMRSLVLLEGFALAALGLWILRRMGRWREIWPGALLVLFPSAYMLTTLGAYSMPYYASPVVLLFLAAGCFAVLDPPGGEEPHRAPWKEGAWAALGAFFLGMSVSNSLAAMGMAVPLAVVALWNTAGRWQWRPLAWRAGGLVTGGFLGLLPHLLSRWLIPGSHAAVSTMVPAGDAWVRFWKMTLPAVLPGTLGCQPCLWPDSEERLAGLSWTPTLFAWGAAVLLVAALVLALVRLLREGLVRRRWPVMGPFEWAVGAALAAAVLDSLNRRATSSDLRYLLAVAYVAPFLVAGLWQRLRGRILRGLLAAVAVALAVFDAATALRLAEVWKEPGFGSRMVACPDLAPALDLLRKEGIRHAVASHWAAYRIGFEADGDVVCAQPRNERFSGWPLPYKAEVDASDDVAYVLTDAIRFLKPKIFEDHLRTMHVEADVVPAGEFRIYCHFRQTDDAYRALPLGTYATTASCLPEKAAVLADGSMDTRWQTPVAQTNGLFVECTFSSPVPLAGMRLRYGIYSHDRPRKLAVEVLRAGEWTPVEVARVVSEPFFWQNNHPVYSDYSTDRLEFATVQDGAEAARVIVEEAKPGMCWTLFEVEPLLFPSSGLPVR